jgi:hypothetical protein
MEVEMKVLVAAIAAALVTGGGALGYTLRGAVDVPAGQSASFVPEGWRCVNLRTSIQCGASDAYPYAILASSSKGVSVKVVTRLGTMRRTNDPGLQRQIYTFTSP